MIKKLKIHIDCKYYLGAKPCKFHKKDGRLCEECIDYHPISKRIIIVKLEALGDVLRTTSILPALKDKYPNSYITWITKNNAIELLDNNPFINRIFTLEENYLQYLLNEQFDIGICLDADPQSSTILSLSTCKEKYGFVCNNKGQSVPVNIESEKWYFIGLNDKLKKTNRKTYQKHIYDICKLDCEIQKPQLILCEQTKKTINDFRKKHGLNKYNKIIGINTGGGKRWQLKKWTLENYIKLIKLLKNNHPQVGLILFGGPDEIDFNEKIKSQVSEMIIDAGCDNSIQEFSALINLTDIFFTPDSLGMHISTALNKITIVIVGPTSPWELDVFGKGEIIYNRKMQCIPCYNETCDKNKNCMNTINTHQILNKLEKYL